MSYEVPSDARRDRQTRIEIDRNRNLAKFSPTYSTQASQENIGTAVGGATATGVTLGSLVLDPELHIVGVQLSWTGGTGKLEIGDIVDSSTTAWQGKLLLITTGNSTAGTGVFEQQNTTAFVDGAQTLTETPADWVGTYTNTSVVTGQLVITSASMIIDDLSGSPTINTIHGVKNDGQFTTLKPIEGKTLTIASGGNIDTTGFTVTDDVFATLQFHEDNITPDTSGSWTVALAGSAGEVFIWTADHSAAEFSLIDINALIFRDSVQLGITAIDTATADGTFDRLEYEADVLGAHDFFVNRSVTTIPRFGITQTTLESNVPLNMNITGPVGDSGRINFTNNAILLSAKNSADDGNLEFKVTNDAPDRFDFTDSAENEVTIQLRAQHATELDQKFIFKQFSGTGAASQIDFPNILNIVRGADLLISLPDATNIDFFESSDAFGFNLANPAVVNMGALNALVFNQFATIGKSISRFATGLHYDIENTSHVHLFRVGGATPADALEINNTEIKPSKDVNMNTFDIFNVDLVTFALGGANLLDTDVGWNASTTGSLLGNFLSAIGTKWEITEENVPRLTYLTTGNTFAISDVTPLISITDTASGSAATLAKFSLSFSIDDPTQIDLQIGATLIASVDSTGITMANNKFIANVDQIGFRITGNFVEDDTNGLRLITVPTDFVMMGDGTATFMTVQDTHFDIGGRYWQLNAIASPGVTGSATLGRVFIDSGNSNHISIIRNGSVIDLEGGGATELDDLTDVTITAPNAGEFLRFNGSLWVESNIILGDLPANSVNLAELAHTNDGSLITYSTATNPIYLDPGAEGEVLTAHGAGAVLTYEVPSILGSQESHPWELHETTQLNKEIYMSNSKDGADPNEGTPFALIEDTLIYVPFWLSVKSKAIRLGFENSAVTGTFQMSMGLYSNRTDGQNYPGTKLVQFTTFFSGTGAQESLITATTMDPGLYWIALDCTNNNTVDLRGYLAGHCNAVGYEDKGTSGFEPIFAFQQSHASTTLPTTPANDLTIIDSTFTVPAMFIKFNVP